MSTRYTLAFTTIATLAACKAKSSMIDNVGEDRAVAALRETMPENESRADDKSGGAGTAMALDEGKMGKKESSRRGPPAAAAPTTDGFFGGVVATPDEKPRDAPAKSPEPAMKNKAKHAGDGEKSGGEETATTRAWFPETFLWNPLVVTDDGGKADVPVRVPDRLTTWHVLALAHSRTGAQAGAVTSFAGTLPSYVDVVVPAFLTVGDSIKLPVQVVDTTAAPITAPLVVTAENATLGPIGGPRTIPAGGSLVEYATLDAKKPGIIKLKAAIGTTDAVIRTIEVLPGGKPVTTNKSGTLAAPRTLSITGPADADPATDRVRLVVYPGALALLRSELGVSTARRGIADDAYALALAGRAPALLAALGDQANPDAIRDLALVAGQKIIRDARTLELEGAMVIVEGALAHPQNPVMSRLAERAADFLAGQQRPDGSYGGGNGWTLQRVIVSTADGARAVAADDQSTAAKQRGTRIATRASGFIERNGARITDGYTAAAILASNTARGELATTLHKILVDAIAGSTDGAKYLDAPTGIVRADGLAPSRAEATALAILALSASTAKDDRALVADLGATLLGSYSPIRGWGDGRANLLAMRAVIQLFKDPVPPGVTITLSMDGTQVAQRTLDRAALRESLALEAATPAGVAGTHEWKIVAEPAVPGLAYALVLSSWVPWPKETTHDGLELALPDKLDGTVGKPLEIALTAIAPSGSPIHVTQALPAGVQVDTPSLDKLVSDGVIERFQTSDGKVELFVPALNPGQTFAAKYKVIPTLAGTLHAGASEIEQNGIAFHVAPTAWTIK